MVLRDLFGCGLLHAFEGSVLEFTLDQSHLQVAHLGLKTGPQLVYFFANTVDSPGSGRDFAEANAIR